MKTVKPNRKLDTIVGDRERQARKIMEQDSLMADHEFASMATKKKIDKKNSGDMVFFSGQRQRESEEEKEEDQRR